MSDILTRKVITQRIYYYILRGEENLNVVRVTVVKVSRILIASNLLALSLIRSKFSSFDRDFSRRRGEILSRGGWMLSRVGKRRDLGRLE